MQYLVIIIFSIFILLVNLFIKNKIKRVYVYIFLLIWFVVLIMSSFNLYGLYEVSVKIYYLIFFSIFCFLLGVFLSNKGLEKKKLLDDKIKKSKKEVIFNITSFINKLNKNIFIKLIMLLNLIFIFRYYSIYQKALVVLGSSEARRLRFFSGELFSSTLEIYFYNYYFETIAILSVLYISFVFVFSRFTLLAFINLLYVYFFANIGAGRFLLIEISFYVIVISIIKRMYFGVKSTFIKKGAFSFIFLCLYLIAIYFQNIRRGIYEYNINTILEGNERLLEHAVIYNIGPLRALEQGVNSFNATQNYKFFRLYFGGLDEFITVFLNYIGFKVTSANLEVGEVLFNEISIGVNQNFNALYTNIFYMYADFNLLGVFVCSIFNGIVFSYFFKRFYVYPTMINIIIFAFFTVTLYLSNMNWSFTTPSSWIFIFMCFYFSIKNK
ncbi:oligosaccharide repeat unit polymerase [Polaribacter sp. MSW13]|uniref:Oligosaccharide repeat unit polymerase n=1 Tax=Polaribacter marinus TaxID=2916838 RepID=A0A9X1VL74_9FLAO|nr:O-antigen polymerase [Polaribacter marinus]MCI2227542.1 oligosaccharide repeat unit polymerase [Polaribacter marinus]